jgi:hypothetical protein
VVRDQIDLQESRLGDRARLNLTLLYGGRRGGGASGPSSGSGGGVHPFGPSDLDF